MKSVWSILVILFQISVHSQENKAKNDWPDLQRYANENKSIAMATKPIVLMGDSITEFWKTTDPSFFVKTAYLDRGISGQTTSQMLLRFRQDVIGLNAAAVVILAGTNDIAENTGPISLESILGNIISMCELAKANKIKVILCSALPANRFWWNPEIMPADKIISLNAMIKDYAKRNNIIYIDYYSPMADLEKGLDKRFADDGVHPNLTGYKLMEPLLEKGIAEAMKIK